MTDRFALIKALVRASQEISDGNPFSDGIADEAAYVLSMVELAQGDETEVIRSLILAPPMPAELAQAWGTRGDFEDGLEWYLAGHLAVDARPFLGLLDDLVSGAQSSRTVRNALGLVPLFSRGTPDVLLPVLSKMSECPHLGEEDLTNLLSALSGSTSMEALGILDSMRAAHWDPDSRILDRLARVSNQVLYGIARRSGSEDSAIT